VWGGFSLWLQQACSSLVSSVLAIRKESTILNNTQSWIIVICLIVLAVTALLGVRRP